MQIQEELQTHTSITLECSGRTATVTRLPAPHTAFRLRRTERHPTTGAEYHFEDFPKTGSELAQMILDWLPRVDRGLITLLRESAESDVKPSPISLRDYHEYLSIIHPAIAHDLPRDR